MEPRGSSASENQPLSTALPGDCLPPQAPAAEKAGTGIKSIAGVYQEASAKTMSLYDAVKDHLLQRDLAASLLEAQAATGGIVAWKRKQLVSVAEALRMGLVGLEMKERLLSAERARTGFVDPYTEEKISLYQAIQKELIGKEQGLSLLDAQIATGGIIDPSTGHRVSLQEACERGYLGEEMRDFLCDPGNESAKSFWDPNSNQRVTYRELMRRCIADPAGGLLLLPLKISFPGLRGGVCSHELLDSGIIDASLFQALHNGEITAQEVAEMDPVQQYLSGTGSIAGVAVLEASGCRSIYQALMEHLLPPGTAVTLLQAQAATGGLIDPIKNEKFTADAAVQAGVVGPELHDKLSAAERAVTGYKDPYTGETVSLFQAIQKGLVPRDLGIFLLDAQLATGGIVDPHTHHRLPVEVACQRGLLDRDTHTLLSNPTEGTRGFFEPSSKETLSYAELLLRCVTDPDTGLYLLPLSGDPRGAHSFIDHSTQFALKNKELSVDCGKFKGQRVPLWKLLFSDYFTGKQRRSLIQQFRSGSLSTQKLADIIRDTIRQVAASSEVTFEGLREKVTPAQLLSSKIINQDLFEKLTQGEASAKDVVGMGMVKKYLEGTGSIGGLILPDSEERISIYQAKRKGFLRPGTSLILLEAQAATGYLIDPSANKKYSVDEALRANLIGPEVYDKLLAAEKAVTGYTDPYTGNKISLFQAMMKDLIVKEHAIRLLEAQIATGGIIDPVNSLRLPVEAAYQRGYFDKKMNLILSDPRDDTKGFFDPNTHENLTYLQLKEKCITDSSTGLCLLPLNSKRRQFIDDATKQAFESSWLFVKYGRFQGQKVSVWDLLNSEYFSEGKRREIFNHYCLRMVTLEHIKLMLEEEMKKWAHIKFPALRGHVTAYHLMECGILDRGLFERLLEGAVSPEEVLRMDSVRKYLYGTGSIGGIVLQPSNEKVGLYEAMKRNILLPGVALPLLEAQAATGFLIDPVNRQKVSLDDAVKGGLIGPELYDKLQRAEEAVTGCRDPFTGKKISLFQAMKKGLVPDQQAVRLLDAQLSTGGVIDPHRGHYVPVEFAQKKGYLDENLGNVLSRSGSDAKTFSTLDSKENVSYRQLIDRCQQDEGSGFHLLPLSLTASPVYTDAQIEHLFRETLVEEKGLTVWELLNSGYFTEEQRRELLEKFRSRAISLQQLIHLVLGLIKEMEMKAQAQVTFRGLRGSVPAVWLLDVGILSEQIFADLVQGRRTAEEVAEMEGVKQYLQGTGSIVGVFLQASNEKMGIYQAMQKNLLMPGMGARLLEAQAATGSIVDLGSNHRLSVEEATKAGVVGKELTEQLLQAERALTGYRDPYSGRLISVCQAIRKELVPAAAGIPLLEAQLATGGVMDPIHHHHLPLLSAFKHGFYDEEMHKSLSQSSDDSCVFFDPNTQESLTYQQLKDRCLQDPQTGLLLLPLSEDAAFYGDRQIMEVLKSEMVSVGTGRFKGQVVSLWDLLNSEYISNSKRRELLRTYKEEDAKGLQQIITVITKVIEETETQGKRFTFKGLRKQVSASDLFQAELIDKETLDELHQGKKTVQEVTEMNSVRKFLEGCNFIAGVLIQPSRAKMTIYQAMRQGLLRPGMALVLLEAQAATGFLIDPVKNKKLSVDEGMATGLIGREIYEKLLSAERAVTGYTHPYTKEKISLFEAMNEELIVRSHGIRLLEAQIATGGIIDPVHSHRIPVEVAYKRGYFDEKMNQILSDPTDDTKGFFDPNTHENLTYLQLLERCVQDPETGLYMLQIVRRGERYFYIDETTKQFLQAQSIQMHVGRYRAQTVSVWDLLCSPYIQEQKRKDLVRQYKCEMLTFQQLVSIITTIIEETEQRAKKLMVKGPRGEVSAAELFNSEIIDKKTLDGLLQGAHALGQLIQKDSVKRYLEGTGCIAGVSVASRKMTVYEAMRTGHLSPENGLLLLEAQAATGFITDPLKKKTFSVNQAVSARIVGDEIHKKLLFAEKAVTGYTDPDTGNKLSLFQAMKKNLIEKAYALRLLEAQVATGGVIDPEYGHHIPVEVAYKRGCLDEDTFDLLSDPEYGNKGFVDPNTHERITYAQLLQRCIKDKDTGMYLLQLLNKSEYFYVDDTTKNILSSTKVNVKLGKYAGQTLSVWELLCSDYFNEEKRKELIKKYKQKSLVILQHITNEILSIIEEKERNRRDIWFQGLRQQVTASELFKADIISQETIKKLEEGRQTVQEVANMDSVRRYLEGTSCVAGILVPSMSDPSKMKKMTIYEAMWRGILRPGTALVLLEAQAATGFIVDPLKNEKLSVDDAVSTGLVGGEIHGKLLAAEKAVTGYTDPYTGKRISLFQAMKKDLIIKEHGIRLLEAQIATGGIIDPVNSHRIPVEVAYKRGYFDEQMNQILLDPTDDTKGFFDPNTHENLTYVQLLKRCQCDPDTGLLMLQIEDKGFGAFHSEENFRQTLRSTTIKVSLGQFKEQDVSLWDLLFSTYISQHKRQQLLKEYKDGKITLKEITTIIKSIIKNTEVHGSYIKPISDLNVEKKASQKEDNDGSQNKQPWKNSLQTTYMTIKQESLPDQCLSVWDVLFSGTIPQDKREQLLRKYRRGRLRLEELTESLASLFTETTSKVTVTHPRAPDTPSPAIAACTEGEEEEEEEDADVPGQDEREMALKARMVEISVGEFRGQKVSLWDLLHSKYIPEEKRKEILHLYKTGILTIDQMETVITGIVNRTEEEKMKEAASHSDVPSSWEDPLRNHTVVLHVGEFQGQEASLWDLLFSQYISESQREELLTRYRSGILCIPDMIATVASILTGREGGHIQDVEGGLASKTTLLQAGGTMPAMQDQELEEALQMITINMPVDGFQGDKRSAWELLFSKYVTAEKRQELLQMYRVGAITAEELIQIIITLIEETKEKSNTLKFPGLRRQVTASELFSSQIIDQDTLSDLTRGAKTVEEITEMDSVKKYLEGTSCIAGVLVPSKSDPSKMQKMTIYEAMWKGILRPGTALVLLEAQAATGFIIDPLNNKKLSVDDAVSAGLVGFELQEKLLSAERAVTGYNDPYTGDKISLFQAMKKGLIVKDHGIRLLEAQIATGGIIDPVHSHRLPVEMAYKRSYFDEEMNQILSDPTDDTKGFFDPNTHENLTYMQLRLRCIPDPDTGLLMLHLMEKGSLFSALNDSTRKSLQSTKTTVDAGIFQGQEVSVWDLLFSSYIPPHKRLELLRQYKTGTITLQDIIQTLTAIVTETEERNARHTMSYKQPPCATKRESLKPDTAQPSQEETWEKTLKTTATHMLAGEHHGQQISVWDLLFSRYITEDKRTELLELYQRGGLPMDRLISILTTLVTKKESTSRKLDIKVKGPAQEIVADEEAHVVPPSELENWEISLRSHHLQVPLGELQSQQLSLWDALFSQFVPENEREELLSNYRHGRLQLEELTESLASLLAETASRGTMTHPRALDIPSPAMASFAEDAKEEEDADVPGPDEREMALKARMVKISVGEFHGQKVSLWDLLHSKYIPEEKRKEILHLYKTGILTIDQMETVITGIVNRTEEEKMKEAASHSDAASSWEDPLRNHTVVLHVGEFQGQETSLWDLLFSQYIPEDKREELLNHYRQGRLKLEELTEILASPLAETTSRGTETHPRAPDTPSPAMATSAEEEQEEGADVPEQGKTEGALKARMVEISVGEFRGQKVSLWDLLHSKYIPEEKRKEILHLYKMGILTIDQMETVITGIVNRTEEEKMKEAASHSDATSSWEDPLRNHIVVLHVGEFQGQEVSLWDLLFSPYIPEDKREELLNHYRNGNLRLEELTESLAPLLAETTSRGTATHPRAPDTPSPAMVTSAEEAKEGEEGADVPEQGKTEGALKARMVEISIGEFRGQKVSLWDLLHSKYIPEEKRKEILHLYKTGILTIDQMETVITGIVNRTEEEKMKEAASHSDVPSSWEDPLRNHTVVLHVGEFQGQEVSLWDLLFSQYIPEDKREELLNHYRNGNLQLEELTESLAPLLAQTTSRGTATHPRAPDTPSPAMVTSAEEEREKSAGVPEQGKTEGALKARMVEISVGEFRGQKVSLWDLLHSKYIPEEKRKEILHLYKMGILTIDQMETVITGIVNRTEEEKMKEAASCISRGPVASGEEGSAQSSYYDLLQHTSRLENIDVTIREIQGQTSSVWDPFFSQFVSNIRTEEVVQRHGTPAISVKESIRSITTVITQTESTPFAVEESEKGDMFPDMFMASASQSQRETENALTSRMFNGSFPGVFGQQVSLWDACHCEYIPEEKRKVLLDQFETGMLTTDQLETIVSTILNSVDKEKVKEGSHPVSHSELWEDPLRNHTVVLQVGEFPGQETSLWDLLFSQYISEDKREELLSNYRHGRLRLEELTESLASLLAETTSRGTVTHSKAPDTPSPPMAAFAQEEGEEDADVPERDEREMALKARMVEISAGEFRGQKVSLWDLLHSKYIPEEKRKEILELYKTGILTIDQVETVITGIVNRTEEEKVKEAASHTDAPSSWEDPLRNHTVVLHVGEFPGQETSLWDLLFSPYIPEDKREELLSNYRNGWLRLEELTEILAPLLAEMTSRGTETHPRTPDTPSPAMAAFAQKEEEEDVDVPKQGETEGALKARMVEISVGEFRGQKVSLWDLLHSKYIPEEKRKEILELYKTGILTIDQVETVITGIVNRTEEENTDRAGLVSNQNRETQQLTKSQNVSFGHSLSLENLLRSESSVVPVGDFQGQMVSCWDLLFSRYISEDKRQELLKKFKENILSLQELISTLTSIITEAERHNQAARPGSCQLAVSERSDDSYVQQQLKKSLRTTMVHVTSGELKGQKVCVLDLLFSKYVSQDKRQELLELYRAGTLPIQDMVMTITTLIEEAERKPRKVDIKRKMLSKIRTLSWTEKGAADS